MDEVCRKVRHFIYSTFVDKCRAPFVEEIMNEFHYPREQVERIINRLNYEHYIQKVPDVTSHQIYTAWPFCNLLATGHEAVTEDGRRYCAATAFEAIGIHFALNLPVRISSLCYHTSNPIFLTARDGEVRCDNHKNPVFLIVTPFRDWFANFISTCENDIMIFESRDELFQFQLQTATPGEELNLAQMTSIAKGLFADITKYEYEPLTVENARRIFQENSLYGEFWRV